MENETEDTLTPNTVYLEDVGQHPAKPAGDLQPGELVVMNHGISFRVLDVVETTQITVRVFLESQEGEIVSPHWLKNQLKAYRAA